MNNKTVIGAEQCCSDHVSCKRIEMTVGGLLPEYRALLEGAGQAKMVLESTVKQAAKDAGDYFDKSKLWCAEISKLTAERDALKANLDEAMRLLLEAPVIDAIEVLQEAGPSLVPDTLANWTEEVAALRERTKQ